MQVILIVILDLVNVGTSLSPMRDNVILDSPPSVLSAAYACHQQSQLVVDYGDLSARVRVHSIQHREYRSVPANQRQGIHGVTPQADIITSSYGTGRPIIEGCFAAIGLFGSDPATWYR